MFPHKKGAIVSRNTIIVIVSKQITLPVLIFLIHLEVIQRAVPTILVVCDVVVDGMTLLRQVMLNVLDNVQYII